MSRADPLLSVRDLKTNYPITEGLLRRETGRVRAVDGVSFDVRRGEVFGLVGESGCGKSTTALSILRLEEPTGGTVEFNGQSVRELDGAELRRYRRRAQLVLQDPNSAFNPRLTVGETVAEPLRVHGVTDSAERRRVAANALDQVGLSDASLDAHTHEFSGGEKQRIAIARALVLNPELIIADEPASALDGRTKAAVLELLTDLQAQLNLGLVIISHDLDLVRRYCDRLGVMYLGEIVERGECARIIETPHHPYTRALLRSVPSLDPTKAAGDSTSPELISDELPDASDVPTGCRFHPRCPSVIPPDELTLSQAEWRGIFTLRQALTPGRDTDIDPVVDEIATDGAATAATDRLRDRLGLPAELSDTTAESAVDTALAALEQGDTETASDRLAAVGRSVCVANTPTLTDTHTDRAVACHRYDPSLPGHQLAGRSVDD